MISGGLMASRTLKSLKKAHEREINSVHSRLLPVKMLTNANLILFSQRETIAALGNPMTIHW